jgi:hypothetical protein
MNKVKLLCVEAPKLLKAKENRLRLCMDNELRYDYEISNPDGVYKASLQEFFTPELRFKNAFKYKIPLKMYSKRKYIIKLLAFCSFVHTERNHEDKFLTSLSVSTLRYKISKYRKWLLRREPKHPDVKRILSVNEALRAWWNG